MKKTLFLLTLISLFTCSRDNIKDLVNESNGASVRLSVNLGNFFLGGTGTESPWVHQYQSSVDITFSSTTTLFTKTVTFNPNDLANFPETLLPYGTYTWEISKTGADLSVSDVLYVYGTSASPFTVDAASIDIALGLSTDYGLVTVSATNMESVTIRQNGTTSALTTKDGYYYGYINSAFTDYTVVIATTDGLGGADQITTPQASIHYNYNVVLESLGQAGVTMSLTDVFLLEDRDILASSDDDQDGVANSIDLCPETRAGAPVDANGCLDVIELDANGVTIKAKPGAANGDQQELNGEVYTVVDETTLRAMVANDEDVTRVVTTLVTDMNYLFQRKSSFNPEIGSWDVSNVTNMRGLFEASDFNGDISNWNTSNVINMGYMFNAALAFNGDLSSWNVSNVTDMSTMFNQSSFNGNISNWNVSNVINMSWMFRSTPFNQDLSSWDVSNVLDMSVMFEGTSFNGDISNWNTSKVTNMSNMFNSTPFNGDLSNWDVGNVTNMAGMFTNSQAFNSDLSNWNVSNVTNMYYMFQNTAFNGDISNWDVSNVTNMAWMFRSTPFNQDISNWNVGNVVDMSLMFDNSSFNGDLSTWNTSNVTNMSYMFSSSPFDGDISGWNVSRVNNMAYMFQNSPFNSDISNWDVSNVTNMSWMFNVNTIFNQDLSSWVVGAVNQCSFFGLGASNWTLPKPNFTNCTP